MLKKILRYFSIILSLNTYPLISSEIISFTDLETEEFIVDLAKIIYKNANLDANNIRVFFIVNDSINAFVDQNNRIYVFSGLLLKLNSALEIFSVLSHEIGHLACNHITRIHGKMAQLMNIQLASLPLFVLAGLANPAAAFGSFIISEGLLLNELCKYTLEEEKAADTFAIKTLIALNYSTKGLVDAFKKILLTEKLMDIKNISFKTHPNTSERIRTILQYNNHDRMSLFPQKFEEKFERIFYKLNGFLKSKKFFDQHSLKSKKFQNYGLALIMHKTGHPEKARQLIDNLINQYKNDPYFLETKAQILYENNNYIEAVSYYLKSINSITMQTPQNHYKKAYDIYLNLTKCILSIITSENPIKIKKISGILNKINNKSSLINYVLNILKNLENVDDMNIELNRCLLACYRLMNNEGMKYFIIGKISYLEGKLEKSYIEVSRAIKVMKSKGIPSIQAEDFLFIISQELKKYSE